VVVLIAEEEEYDHEGLSGDRWLLGTFEGHVETEAGMGAQCRGLTAEEAIEWGRARAGRVVIRLGDSDYYSAGAEAEPGEPTWPPADLGTLVRRRPESERWKDRTADDPPIEWVVPLAVEPPQLPALMEDIDRATRVAAEAAGVKPPKRRRRVRRGSYFYEPVEGVPFRVVARTREEAVATAIARCPVPDGWSAQALLFAVKPL
jgi:hypothetical protein